MCRGVFSCSRLGFLTDFKIRPARESSLRFERCMRGMRPPHHPPLLLFPRLLPRFPLLLLLLLLLLLYTADSLSPLCPSFSCGLAPTQCPPSSSLKTRGGDGCAICPSCLDSAGNAVEVPLCWGGGARACPPPPTCGSGTSAVVTVPKGADGGEPCCTQYACLAAERTVRGRPPWRWPLCPSKTACPAPPAKCPSGSSLGVPRDATMGGGGFSGGGAGCPGCETCIDEAGTGRAVALPPCAAAAANAGACPAPPACGTDMTMVIKTPAGANGALPCCPDYACLAPRPSASEAAQGNRQACPARTCVSEPARCSPGARLEQAPRDDAGCPGCPACLGSEGEVVPVPACWARPFSCPPLPVCEPGYAAVLAALRGSAGTAPCCDTYECRPGTDAEEARNQPGGRRGCAALSCSTMPTRCPANATRRSEKDYMGCPSCPTCLDDKTSERVSVPACYAAPVICPPGACEPGQRSVLKVPRDRRAPAVLRPVQVRGRQAQVRRLRGVQPGKRGQFFQRSRRGRRSNRRIRRCQRGCR